MEAKIIIDKSSGKMFIQHPNKEERERVKNKIINAVREDTKALRKLNIYKNDNRRSKTITF